MFVGGLWEGPSHGYSHGLVGRALDEIVCRSERSSREGLSGPRASDEGRTYLEDEFGGDGLLARRDPARHTGTGDREQIIQELTSRPE